MNIRLIKIELWNIYGFNHLELRFNGADGVISGRNGIGKSTVYDAFLWCLFGKDAEGRPDYEIKPRGEDGEGIEKVESIAVVSLNIDGATKIFERNYHEIWKTTRGESVPKKTGHTTDYKINGAPIGTEKEYKAEIASILDENAFRLLTDVKYFMNLPWAERRQKIVELSGADMTDAQFAGNWSAAGGNEEYANIILTALNAGKTIDRYKKELSANKTETNVKLKAIPARIDEVRKSLPEEVNIHAIEKEIETLNKNVSDINAQIEDKTSVFQAEQNKRAKLLNESFDIENKAKIIANRVRREITEDVGSIAGRIAELKSAAANKTAEVSACGTYITNTQKEIDRINSELNTKRAEFETIATETLSLDGDDAFCCPTCKRMLEPEDIEAKKVMLLNNFNDNKQRRMDAIRSAGKQQGALIEQLKKVIADQGLKKGALQAEIDTIAGEVAKMESQNTVERDIETEIASKLAANEEYQQLIGTHSKLQSAINEPITPAETGELNTKRADILSEINDLNGKMFLANQRANGLERIAELEKEEKELAQIVADYDKAEYAIQLFTKYKMDAIQDIANGLFPDNIRVRLFEEQMNGGEKPICDILIDGVPYPRANTAKKINAGISAINMYQRHYGLIAPIFVDNKESVTDLIDTDAQVISLQVDGSKKKLELVLNQEKISKLFA